MDVQKSHHAVIAAIWKLLRDDLLVAPTITSSQDRRWVDMVDRYEQIEKAAPAEVRYYVSSMVALHVDILERMWRK